MVDMDEYSWQRWNKWKLFEPDVKSVTVTAISRVLCIAACCEFSCLFVDRLLPSTVLFGPVGALKSERTETERSKQQPLKRSERAIEC